MRKIQEHENSRVSIPALQPKTKSPTWVATAFRYAAIAAATSCSPVPVESKTMISVAFMRPRLLPATTSPSSACTYSRDMAPAAIAWWRSPIAQAWSVRSVTTVALAMSAGSISCFFSLSAPTAATNVPGFTMSRVMK